jgi:putative ATP-dependent endonuclease of OLD family
MLTPCASEEVERFGMADDTASRHEATSPSKPAAPAGPTETADVRIARLRVDNFRGIESLLLDFGRRATFLVGENNAGKSTILHAVAVALGARQAMQDDLRRVGSDVEGSATIDVFLSPASGGAFAETTRQQLQTIQRYLTAPRDEVVAFRTKLSRSNEGSRLSETRTLLQPVGENWVESQSRFRPEILRLVSVHLLDASRDLISELGSQTSTWGRVVADLKIPDLPDLPGGEKNPRGRAGLEEDLGAFAARLRAASPVLGQLETDLRRLGQTQSTAGDVRLVALPPRIEELARTIEVVITQRDDTSLPLRFHGLGSRSLAALLVFQTMCSLRVGQDQGVKPHLVTLLEEPESHLHPQAIVALRDVIAHLEGQTLVTTHSPQLVAELPPGDVRVIRRTAEGTRALGLPEATAKKIAQFRRFVERPHGEIFFARLVVFGDGTSERNALPVLVAPLLGADPAGLGVTFVDCESMGDPKVGKAIEALYHLETPWLVFADNDESGIAALAAIVDPATGNPLTFGHPSVIKSGNKQIEQLLVDAGYLAEVTAVANETGNASVGDEKQALKFLTKNKSWAAEAVARAAVEAGKAAPAPIHDLANAIRDKLAALESESRST